MKKTLILGKNAVPESLMKNRFSGFSSSHYPIDNSNDIQAAIPDEPYYDLDEDYSSGYGDVRPYDKL